MMRRGRRARFVIYTNSAYMLAAARFSLLIEKIKGESQRLTDASTIVTTYPTYQIITKKTEHLRSSPTRRLFNIREIFVGRPRGHDPKIQEMNCIYEKENPAGKNVFYDLHFEKVTLHRSFSIDEDFLSNIYSVLESIRNDFESLTKVQIPGWKPSFLILKSVNQDPTFSNRDFLVDLQVNLSKQNRWLMHLCDTVWEMPIRAGVISYEPITQSGRLTSLAK